MMTVISLGFVLILVTTLIGVVFWFLSDWMSPSSRVVFVDCLIGAYLFGFVMMFIGSAVLTYRFLFGE